MARVADAGAADALGATVEMQSQGAATSPGQRSRILRRTHDLLLEHHEDFAGSSRWRWASPSPRPVRKLITRPDTCAGSPRKPSRARREYESRVTALTP
ncbi:hypothetical protein [Streptomyces sp. S5]|uniref:hypothetical protein n=1 Tax=Streptomyces sp. S5 TaxID=1456735 RepID=UPI0034D22A52